MWSKVSHKQRISVMDKFKKKIQEQAKENMSIGGSSDKKGSPNGKRRSNTIKKKILKTSYFKKEESDKQFLVN